MRRLVLFSVSALLSFASAAHATTIVLDFEGVAPPGTIASKDAGPGAEYTEDGFGLDVEDVFSTELHFVSSAYAAAHNYVDHASDYAVTNFGLKFVLSREDGGLFDAVSFAANHDTDASPSIVIDVTGLLADNTAVHQQFTTDGNAGLQTLIFGAQFAGVRTLQFDADSWLAYDDITLVVPNAVPEPASWAIVLFGAGTVIATARRMRER
jgi:hypothetical protein